MSDDQVRGKTPAGQGFRLADSDLDRAIASLTEASPSPALRANVMRRIAEEQHAPPARGLWDPASLRLRSGQAVGFWTAGLRGRLAFGAVAVVVIAASIWFVLKPAPVRQIVNGQPVPHGVAQPSPTPQADQSLLAAQTAAPPTRAGETSRTGRALSQPYALTHRVAPAMSAEPVEALPTEQAAPAVSPIEMPPLPDPPPVTMTPMTTQPIEIPEIEIRPVDEPPASAEPSRQDPDKKQPGGTLPGAIR